MKKPLKERFMQYIEKQPNGGCWLWTGGLSNGGYGKFQIDPKTRLAHRVAYEIFIGPVPEGAQLDHLCRQRRCCNPSHLEPVACKENIRRGASVTKQFCVHGHERTPENIYVYPDGRRRCILCRRIHDMQPKYAARREARRRQIRAEKRAAL